MNRRTARVFAIAAVLGMVTTVVATAICVWISAAFDRARTYDASWNRDGAELRAWLFESPGKSLFIWFKADTLASGPGPLPDREITRPPWWVNPSNETVARVNLDDGNPQAGTTREEMAYGWPMVAFRGGISIEYSDKLPSPITSDDTGFSLPETRHFEARAMPYIPLARGCLVNSAIYGALWWLVLFAPGIVRHRRRKGRGACLGCGYDRRGLEAAVCPECGDKSPER